MAGILGFMAAGAAKGFAEGQSKQIADENEFNLKQALIDANYEKDLMLKRAGIELEQQAEQAQMDKRKGYMEDVVEDGKEGKVTRKATVQDGAERAMKAGDYDTAEKLTKATPKRETFTVGEGQKVVDGNGKVIAEGNPKPEKVDVNEMIFKAAGGDKQAQAFLDKMSAIDIKKAVAGRAPQRETETESRKRDFIDAYSDNAEYVKNGKLTAKGFDKFNKIENDEYQTVTEAPVIGFDGTTRLGKDGKPLMTTKVTRKEKVPEKSNGALSKDKSGNYIYKR